MRRRSIRVRILALVIVPVLALIGLYVFVLDLTYGSYRSLARAAAVHNAITGPTTALQTQLDAERRLAMQFVVHPTAAGLARLNRQVSLTNAAKDRFDQAMFNPAVTRNGGPGEQQAANGLQGYLARIDVLRAAIVRRTVSPLLILEGYTAMVTQANYVLDQGILQLAGGSISLQANALIGMEESKEIVLQENDLLQADRSSGKFPAADRHGFADLVAIRQALIGIARPQLSPQYQGFFLADVAPQTVSQLRAMETAVIKLPPQRRLAKAPLRPWSATVAAYNKGFQNAVDATAADLTARTRAESGSIVLRLVLAASLGLLAIIAVAGIAVFVARGLIRQLSGLRQSALELAEHQLPEVIGRLHAGEEVTVDEQVRPEAAGPDEIDQVRQAFAVVQRTAIEAAIDEARVRRGVNDVFRNLARRSQSLLNRQLALLDALERRAKGPDELADLFRLDHLTTRMRRHAEGLLILSGGTSGRSWRDPVPVVDVLRAAVAEVEDYTRFRVLSTTGGSVAGYAVADVVHLVAELAENATLFSPVNTPVRVEGNAVAKGVSVEIEDRGLGISDSDLAQINARLADPPQFDLSGSDQLGLFIAARLAKRHDIKITLRASAFGGTSAIVLIPAALIVDPEQDGELPAAGHAQHVGARRVPELLATPAGMAEPAAAVQPYAAGHAAARDASDNGAAPVAAAVSAAALDGPPWIQAERESDGALDKPPWTEAERVPGGGFGARPWTEAEAVPEGGFGARPWTPADSPSVAGTPGGLVTAGGFSGLPWANPEPPGTGPAGGLAAAAGGSGPPWAPAEPPPGVSTAGPGTGYDPPAWQPPQPQPDAGPPGYAGPTWQADADVTDVGPALPANSNPMDSPSLDLPVRVRQASLAPQLRDSARAGRSSGTDAATAPSPESARNTMSAWQRGWERGRSVRAAASDQAPAPDQQ